jgi:hypothetical protein
MSTRKTPSKPAEAGLACQTAQDPLLADPSARPAWLGKARAGAAGGLTLQVPRHELPPDQWFGIKAIVRDLELHERDWAADLLAGYFCEASAPWEQ